MNVLESLKKALNEAEGNEILTSQFHAVSDKSNITFNGKLGYTGNSKISLELSISMPDVIKHYLSETEYNDLTEEQFNEASNKLQKAVQEIAEQFELSLTNKMAAYGLQEGENNG